MSRTPGHRAAVAPSLSFACELDSRRLAELFADDGLIDELKGRGARVLMMVSDHDPRRAEVVRRLNGAGVPVVGIPLFPTDEGYYFTADNWPRAEDRAGRTASPCTRWRAACGTAT